MLRWMAQMMGVSDEVLIKLASLQDDFFVCTCFVLAQPQKLVETAEHLSLRTLACVQCDECFIL